MDETGLKINSELSEKGKFWTSIHFCCRHNSAKILAYILKITYIENPGLYASHINLTTVEGYTCLHLCAIWDSLDCFKVLI